MRFLNSETMYATRYVDIRTDFWKVVRVLVPFVVTVTAGILEIALYLVSCSRRIVKNAFIAGSSKLGNALRASVGAK